MRYSQHMMMAVESKEYVNVNENENGTGGDEDDL